MHSPFSKGHYDPLNGEWSVGASLQFVRNYHPVALLIPDGRVWVAGSNINGIQYPGREEMEYYSPNYLTRGPRPTYTLATNHVDYDQEFVIYLRDGWRYSEIDTGRIAIVKCSSSTHGFCIDQRYVGLVVLTKDSNATEIRVKAPPNGNIATPGYYMLFILSTVGAPSVSAILRVG